MKNFAETILETAGDSFFVAIDPGEKGAIVCINFQEDYPSFLPVKLGLNSLKWFPTEGIEGYKKLNEDTLSEVYERFDSTRCKELAKVEIFVERERVSGLMSPTAAGTFMTGYGFCLGVCHCLGVEPLLMDPQEWQRTLKLAPYVPGANHKPALRKKHYTAEIRKLWGTQLDEVPDYAVDAYGILLAGLIKTYGFKH